VSQKYPGGIISKTAPVTVGPVGGEGGSAPGVWTLTQALELQKQNLWPKPAIPKGLYSWGLNTHGQLGLNNTLNGSSPVQVGALTTWSEIASGGGNYGFSVAVKTDGTMWSWGFNYTGQLGLNNTIYRSSPVQVGALTGWSKIAIGNNFSVAVKTNGTLWSWGSNGAGTLGLNDTYNRSSPVQVGALTAWSQVACGQSHTLATKTDGTLWSWGSNGSGALGLNDTANRSSPVQVGALTAWSQVAAGGTFSLAIKTDGTMWSWGFNYSGQLGLNIAGAYAHRSSPVQIGALTTWSKVAGGNSHGLAIKTNGTMWSWGINNAGRLGLGDTYYRSSPVQIGALTTWFQIAGGDAFTLAIKTNGTLWGWGSNQFGSLGLNESGTPYNRSSPVQVGALTTWSRLGKITRSSASLALANSP